ncbi:LysR substrate-binding domain-containing protein [Peribacillus sp. TH14]|uniref:LysR substrate-binding domain-containing protein n=1 Tax=Peribacillus sp. TH14 TaxID=2798481 RepID=UPI001F5B87AA|nr:LysR substrate-binding domain-containing protein [Peribacillus sp. TH14]
MLNTVESRLADICLSSHPIHKKQIEWTTLKIEPLYVVVPGHHWLAIRSKVKDLEEEEFICFKKGYGLRYIFDEMCYFFSQLF